MSSRSGLVLACLWPRLALAAAFSWVGYLGGGGDAVVYHVLGGFVRDIVVRPDHASLEGRLVKYRIAAPEQSYDIHVEETRELLTGEARFDWRNNVIPLVLLHALAYIVLDHPFAYVALTSLLSALATAYMIRRSHLDRAGARWLIYNPVSIFFAATHYKEAITEVIVICFLVGILLRPSVWQAIACLIIMGFFRYTYVPILASLWAMEATSLSRQRTSIVIAMTMLVFALLPPLYSGAFVHGASGPIYSLVDATVWTRKLLGPIVGFLLPVPFTIPLSYDQWIGGVFYSVYGVFYWMLLSISCSYVLVQARPGPSTRFLNHAFVASLAIGYVVVGTSGVKDRYFAPFMPLLVLGFLPAWRLLVPYVARRAPLQDAHA